MEEGKPPMLWVQVFPNCLSIDQVPDVVVGVVAELLYRLAISDIAVYLQLDRCLV